MRGSTGPAAVANRSRASTTLRRLPALIAATASATARSHCGADRLPSCQRTPDGALAGTLPPARGAPGQAPATAADVPSSAMVVSQARPRPSLPSTTRGTISTDPSDDASKVKLPKATGPVPRARTRSSTSAPSNTEPSHFSAAVNLSSPAGSVTRAASPQPTSPAPRRTQASGSGCGTPASRSPGSGTATVRTTSRLTAAAPSARRRLSTPLPPASPGQPPRTDILGAPPTGAAAGLASRPRPPDAPADVHGQRGHQRRADRGRAGQHAERDREARPGSRTRCPGTWTGCRARPRSGGRGGNARRRAAAAGSRRGTRVPRRPEDARPARPAAAAGAAVRRATGRPRGPVRHACPPVVTGDPDRVVRQYDVSHQPSLSSYIAT